MVWPAHAVTWIGDRWACSCGKSWTAAEYLPLPDPERAIDSLAKQHYFAYALPGRAINTEARLAEL